MCEKSLVELAKDNKLPAHQYIDAKTIAWLKKNQPVFKKTQKIKLPSLKKIKQFVPKNTWFFNRKEIDSIHGLRHLLRVAINSIIINKFFFNKDATKKTVIAAVLHDIRRKEDRGDQQHGLRTANWFKGNVSTIEKYFNVKLDANDTDEIYWSILFHELPISEIEKRNQYLKFKDSINTIRIADALDRFRLPKTKWWINEEILKFKISDNLKKTAFDLVLKSEKTFLIKKNSKNSVLNILK